MYPFAWIEMHCPQHGLERFKIKIIKKYNINPEKIMPKYRTKPKHELSGLIIGRNVNKNEVLDYLLEYFDQKGMLDKIISIKLKFY